MPSSVLVVRPVPRVFPETYLIRAMASHISDARMDMHKAVHLDAARLHAIRHAQQEMLVSDQTPVRPALATDNRSLGVLYATDVHTQMVSARHVKAVSRSSGHVQTIAADPMPDGDIQTRALQAMFQKRLV